MAFPIRGSGDPGYCIVQASSNLVIGSTHPPSGAEAYSNYIDSITNLPSGFYKKSGEALSVVEYQGFLSAPSEPTPRAEAALAFIVFRAGVGSPPAPW